MRLQLILKLVKSFGETKLRIYCGLNSQKQFWTHQIHHFIDGMLMEKLILPIICLINTWRLKQIEDA